MMSIVYYDNALSSLCSASSLNQQSAGSRAHYSDNLYSFTFILCSKWRSNKYKFQFFFFLPNRGLDPRSIALNASTVTITSQLKLDKNEYMILIDVPAFFSILFQIWPSCGLFMHVAYLCNMQEKSDCRNLLLQGSQQKFIVMIGFTGLDWPKSILYLHVSFHCIHVSDIV